MSEKVATGRWRYEDVAVLVRSNRDADAYKRQSMVLVAISLIPLPFVHGDTALSWRVLVRPEGLPWLKLFGLLGLLAIGSGLTRPPVFGLISILTPAHEQGATIGVAQSAGSLARI